MKRGAIDRFEGKYGVVEIAENTEDILITDLPPSAQAGDSIVWDEKLNKWVIDSDETKRMKNEIDTLIDELFED